MKRKLLCFGFLLLATVLTLRAAPKIGDTYDEVIAAKGQPTGVTTAGTTVLLSYPDVVVKLRDGRVTSLKAVSEVSTVPERRITDAERRATATPTAPAVDEDGGWSTDADAALQRAKSSGRHVFLFFTGSDWCGWCMRLQKEILTTPEFASYAQDNLVLVELDFPQRKEQAEALKAQNAKLAKKHGIRGYPTVIVLNSEGKVVGQLGYQAGGPGPFIAKLERM